jgi:hypothetical protein
LLAGSIAGFVALLVSIVLNLRQILFASQKNRITSTYHRPKDLVGFRSKPRFVVRIHNLSALSGEFRHFELLLPRLQGVVTDRGEFVHSPGAELYKDGEALGSRLRARQEFRKIDYLRRTVTVGPNASAVEFFELDAFLPDPPPQGWQAASLPEDFEPVLAFEHSSGLEFHCDASGLQPGPYRWPYEKELRASTMITRPNALELRRGRFRRRWSAHEVTEQETA